MFVCKKCSTGLVDDFCRHGRALGIDIQTQNIDWPIKTYLTIAIMVLKSIEVDFSGKKENKCFAVANKYVSIADAYGIWQLLVLVLRISCEFVQIKTCVDWISGGKSHKKHRVWDIL